MTASVAPPRSIGASLWPLPIDALCILVFAIAGNDAHDSGAVATVLRIAWPFWTGLALTWVILLRLRRRPQLIWPAGVCVVAGTYLVGMALRGLTGHGLAPAFLIVAAIFLTLTLVGWRAVAALLRHRRRA